MQSIIDTIYPQLRTLIRSVKLINGCPLHMRLVFFHVATDNNNALNFVSLSIEIFALSFFFFRSVISNANMTKLIFEWDQIYLMFAA